MHREEEFERLLGDGKPDNNSTDTHEKEEIKAIINHDQQTIRNSESKEGQLPTTSQGKPMTVQGMDSKQKSKL